MNLEKLPALAEALHVRFGGREPFQIVTRLLEATYQQCVGEGLIVEYS